MYETDDILATITDLVALAPRSTGTPGGVAAADLVERRFAVAGLATERLEVPSYAWSATACVLTVDGTEVECGPVLHSALPDHDATGRLGGRHEGRVVDVGDGDVRDHDVRGAVVLFDLAFDLPTAAMLPLTEWIHDPHRLLLRREALAARNPYITSLTRVMTRAARGGAVAVVGVLRDYPESVRYHNEYYRRTLLELPGAWITRDTGARLRDRLRERPGGTGQTGVTGSTARLELRATRTPVASHTVLGTIPGASRETVMVQSHHDSVGPGAVEDASGTAEVIALAEHFGARARRGWVPAKTLLFVTFDTHFTGYHAHQEFARRFALDPASPYDLVLNATIEHVGLRARRADDGGFETLPETEPRGLFENLNPRLKVALVRALRRHGLHSTSLLNASPLEFARHGIPTDASFTLVSGVPTVSLVSGPLYLYDDADTLDKVDVDQLAAVATFFTEVVELGLAARGSTIGLIPAPLRRRLPRGRW